MHDKCSTRNVEKTMHVASLYTVEEHVGLLVGSTGCAVLKGKIALPSTPTPTYIAQCFVSSSHMGLMLPPPKGNIAYHDVP